MIGDLIEIPQLLEFRVGDCGCPEEEWLFMGFNLTIHHELDGASDAFLDGGDYGEAEHTVRTESALAGRAALIAWAHSLISGAPVEGA